jgi:hypothetical protein
MNAQRILAIIVAACWLGTVPGVAHACCHHDHDCAYGHDYQYDCDRHAQGGRYHCPWTPASGETGLKGTEGKIIEIDYLPGSTAASAMVEVRLQSAGQSRLIRLAPVGFLKQNGVLLREGDTISVKGFPVAGMDGDLLIATEVRKGEKVLSLRDTRGRSAW